MQFGAKPDHVTHTWLTRSSLGSVAFDELRYDYSFSYEGEPMDGFVLTRVRSGAFVHRQHGGDVDVCRAGTTTTIAWREGTPLRGEVHTGHFDTIILDRTLLDTVAMAAPRAGSPERVRLTGCMPVSPTANKQMTDTVGYIVGNVVTNPDAARSPLIVGAVTHLLAANMLATFPSTALLEPTIEDRRDSTPVLLRRAMSFIDDNAHRDISVSDIAGAIYITPRALQYMFKKHRDCTPTDYLRTVRLHYAHMELRRSHRLRTTVGQVGLRWGFGHAGRFAVYHRQTYGESPHDTLRRDP